jgi:Ca2+-binding EF-hand superfamily protein
VQRAQNLGESLKEEEIEGLLDEGDLEGDGCISYLEFCSINNLIK